MHGDCRSHKGCKALHKFSALCMHALIVDVAHLSILESLLCQVGARLEEAANGVPMGMRQQDERDIPGVDAHGLQLVPQTATRIAKQRDIAFAGINKNPDVVELEI